MTRLVCRVEKYGIKEIAALEHHIEQECKPACAEILDFGPGQGNAVVYRFPKGDLVRSISARVAERENPGRAVRKDAVVLCETVVSIFDDWQDEHRLEQAEPMLRAAAAFLYRRYRQENCMYASLHMDEAHPHLHFGFVPMTGDGKLSAKRMIDRIELQRLQAELPAGLRTQGYHVERAKEDPPLDEKEKPAGNQPDFPVAQMLQIGAEKEQKQGDLRRENQTMQLEILLLERQLKGMIEIIRSDPQLELLYLRQVEQQAKTRHELYQMHIPIEKM